MGRKSYFEELRTFQLTNISIEWAIREWETLSKEMRIKILTTMAPKYVSDKVEHSGQVDSNISIKELWDGILRRKNSSGVSEESLTN